MGHEWSAPQTEHRIRRSRVGRRYADRCWLSTPGRRVAARCRRVSARVVCCAPVSLVNRRPLRATRCAEPPSLRCRPITAHQTTWAGRVSAPNGGGKVQGAGCAEVEEVEVLDLCAAREAEVEKAHLVHALHVHGGMLGQRRARHRQRLSRPSVTTPSYLRAEAVYHRGAPTPTDDRAVREEAMTASCAGSWRAPARRRRDSRTRWSRIAWASARRRHLHAARHLAEQDFCCGRPVRTVPQTSHGRSEPTRTTPQGARSLFLLGWLGRDMRFAWVALLKATRPMYG